jgi:ATP-dependent DNA helicase RecG
MNEQTLQTYLQAHFPKESAACEWKSFRNLTHAVAGRKGEDIASYISAIANMDGGHLVIGVEDSTLCILGIENFADYTLENIRLRLLGRCVNLNSEDFQVEALVTSDTQKSVWVFHIPKHRPRLPVYAHDKAWQRLDDSLIALRDERRAAILGESLEWVDWTAATVPAAGLEDLDPLALALAREKFKERHANAPFAAEIDAWSPVVFLDRAKLTAKGQMTRAALLLLGKPSSIHFVSPHPAQITWKLDTEEQTYEHFGPPFLLTTTHVLQRIRNIQQKLFPSHQLLATEVAKYDSRVILEALHNCIAHQDYFQQARVLVTEKVDRLIFKNAGGFFEGVAEDYFTGKRTPSRYRSPWLAQAMVQLGMIDTMGYGIHMMTMAQRKRFFPLPDYGNSTPSEVALTIFGRMLDENYSLLLLERQELDIDTVILLDRVQKRLPLHDSAAAYLKREGLIEGRKPNFFVAAHVAKITGNEGAYIRNRAFDDAHYKDLILAYLKRYGSASRADLKRLILDKLSDVLDKKQKENKFRNLLCAMSRKDKTIEKSGGKQKGQWILANSGEQVF